MREARGLLRLVRCRSLETNAYLTCTVSMFSDQRSDQNCYFQCAQVTSLLFVILQIICMYMYLMSLLAINNLEYIFS